jgi:ankyrin repeat protein/truncated hemoglobin YjbI
MTHRPVPEELRHRGELAIAYPAADLWTALGGRPGVEALVVDLYRRMEADAMLRHAFPHFHPAAAVGFFVQWFGGDRTYADALAGGLARRHQHRYVSPATARAWLRCMREALEARGVEAEPVLQPLAGVAAALVHNPDLSPAELRPSCELVQDAGQVQLQELLADTAKGHTAEVREALERDPSLARRRGTEGQSILWMAVYRNRPEILALALAAGADPNAPGCDPLRATLACDSVHPGTGLSVTPLALARKARPGLVPPLLAHGALDDVFTTAWLGDAAGLRAQLERNPELVHALDPADDYQEVTPLAHAVFGGSLECVRCLLDRGAEVRRHSGKLLILAVALNRPDLVGLLIEHGADVRRVDLLGRLNGAERPVADLLFSQGKTAPGWMLPRACRPDVSRNELHRVRVLLEYGAHLEDRDRGGHTALHYAVRGGKLPLIGFLLERGADPEARDEQGRTPLLHLARTRAVFDPLPVLELLVAHGAAVDARDEQQSTLLMHYARSGQTAPVRWLLAHGADRGTTNRHGKRAVDFCRRHPELITLLR